MLGDSSEIILTQCDYTVNCCFAATILIWDNFQAPNFLLSALWTKAYKIFTIIKFHESPLKFFLVSPRGVGVEHRPCNPRVSGLIPGPGNMKKLFIWMKINGLTQNS